MVGAYILAPFLLFHFIARMSSFGRKVIKTVESSYLVGKIWTIFFPVAAVICLQL